MNEIEQYLAKAAGKAKVAVGEDITVKVDLAVAHDVTGPLALPQFEEIGIDSVFDKAKVAFIIDHVFPAATVDARSNHNALLAFARKYGLRIYNQGEGVIHQLIAEEYHLPRGSILVGADSHTCTAGAYGALAFGVGSTELAAVMATGRLDIDVPPVTCLRLEGKLQPGVYAKDVVLHLIGRFGTDGFTDRGIIFAGSWVRQASLDERMTVSNMAIEMGAMLSYFSVNGDPGEVAADVAIDVAAIPPTAACPSSPGNTAPLAKVAGTPITHVVIGSCTNGRLSDMEEAAAVFARAPVHPDVSCIVLPASRRVAEAMEKKGLTAILRQAGAVVTNPGCGPCFGGHLGLVDETDVVAATTNRNFPGRMGAKGSKIYLVSPRAAAEAAAAGKLVVPGTTAPLGGGEGSGR